LEQLTIKINKKYIIIKSYNRFSLIKIEDIASVTFKKIDPKKIYISFINKNNVEIAPIDLTCTTEEERDLFCEKMEKALEDFFLKKVLIIHQIIKKQK